MRKLVIPAVAALACVPAANADTLTLIAADRVDVYDGVIVAIDQQNIIGRLQFGALGYTSTPNAARSSRGGTLDGIGRWTVVIDGQYWHECRLTATAYVNGRAMDVTFAECVP